MWKYQADKGERMAYDFDGQVLPPFKHEILKVDEPFPQVPHSISILTVRLVNSSYFTNYSIYSVKGNCYVNVKLNLKETALSLTNKCSILFRDSLTIFSAVFLSYFLVFVVA
jgi:hypothetical protein